MHADAAKLLWEAQDAASHAVQFARDKSFVDYESDVLLRSAIERQLAIVGEAQSKLRRLDPSTAANIPDMHRMIGFRNVLIHAYATIDNRIAWGVVETNLVPLLVSLQKLLTQIR